MRTALLLLALVACGDNLPARVDAFMIPDTGTPDTPPPPPGCDYGELRDANNDDFTSSSGVPELTRLTFTTSTVLCGNIDSTHFASGVVDIDSYIVTLATSADVYVTLTAPGAEALGDVTLQIYTGMNFTSFVSSGAFIGDHATAVVGLPAGTYEFAMLASNASAITAPIAYKLKVLPGAMALPCAQVTATENFLEANDGLTNLDNDVVSVNYNASGDKEVLTTLVDTPEPSAIVVEPAMSYRIKGASADNVMMDSYKDRDTFVITTGATTNQLSVRLNWPGSTIDMDYLIFPAADATSFATGASDGLSEPEFQTFAVLPNTTYWVWVAAYYTSTLLPIDYDISICGGIFTP